MLLSVGSVKHLKPGFCGGWADGYSTVAEIHTEKVEQHNHHEIHVCRGYVGLLVDCVRSGGHWGVSYVSIPSYRIV